MHYTVIVELNITFLRALNRFRLVGARNDLWSGSYANFLYSWFIAKSFGDVFINLTNIKIFKKRPVGSTS
jgi:hypothetical protein